MYPGRLPAAASGRRHKPMAWPGANEDQNICQAPQRGPGKKNRFTSSPWTSRRARSSSSWRRHGSRSPWHHIADWAPACWPENRPLARTSSGLSCPGSGPIRRFQSFPCGITALHIVTTRINTLRQFAPPPRARVRMPWSGEHHSWPRTQRESAAVTASSKSFRKYFRLFAGTRPPAARGWPPPLPPYRAVVALTSRFRLRSPLALMLKS